MATLTKLQNTIVLRADQQKAIDDIRQTFLELKREGKPVSVLLRASMGFGKTVVAIEIIRLLLERDPAANVCFFINSLSLIKSTLARAKEAGIARSEIAIIQGANSVAPKNARLWIAMAQTLDSWLKSSESLSGVFPELFTLSIFDECHESAFSKSGQWLRSRSSFILGLTGTPTRSDGQSLGLVFSSAVETPTHGELVRNRDLRPIEYAIGSFEKTEKQQELLASATTLDEADVGLSKILEDPIIQRKIIATCEGKISEYAANNHGIKKTLVFAPSHECAVSFARTWAEIRGSGTIGYILAKGCGIVGTDNNDRSDIINKFEISNSGLDILISYSAIATGFDVPISSIAILLRKMGLGLYDQSGGRIVRRFPLCSYSLYLDFADNHERHQPLETRVWNPDQYLAIPKEKEKSEGLTKLCPECGEQHSVLTQVCGKLDKYTGRYEGGCGYVFPKSEIEAALKDWDTLTLRTLHTALWVDVGGTESDRDARFCQVVRDKWIELHNKSVSSPGKNDRIPDLKRWLKEFESEIRLGNSEFKAPSDAISFRVLGKCFDGLPEAKLNSFQVRYTGQSYWNNLVLEIGADEIEFMIDERKYNRKWVFFAKALRDRFNAESDKCEKAIQMFDKREEEF